MKIINFDDINSLNISPTLCYEWVGDMIKNKKNAFLPAKTHMNMPSNVFCNVMPCIIRNCYGNIGGIKVVTRYPERIPSLDSKILLFNADSGEFLTLMDGNWITAMRTGAVAVHSIQCFAKSNWNTVGLIGLGNVARAVVIVLSSIVTDKKITIKLLKYKDQAELFCERFKDYSNLEFIIVDSIKECIIDSDVVVSCATYFKDDIATDNWFKEGVLVVPVHTRGFTNCDLFFDKVFADDTIHVSDFKNFNRFRYFAEVSDFVNNKAIGRENDSERILVYNIGISIHDVNFASHIYNFLYDDVNSKSLVDDYDMHDPVENFWL